MGAGDRGRLGDLDRIAREISDVAAKRDREKAGFAAEFGPKLEGCAQREVKPAQAVTEQPAEAALNPFWDSTARLMSSSDHLWNLPGVKGDKAAIIGPSARACALTVDGDNESFVNSSANAPISYEMK